MQAAAHHPVVDERPPPKATRRLRRRGPRSVDALFRRSHVSQNSCPRQPRGNGLRQSRPQLPSLHDSFVVLHHNIRGFLSHHAEFEMVLASHGYPAFVCLVETFLDSSMLHPTLSGYELVSRRDRGSDRFGGGVAVFAKSSLAARIVHLDDSAVCERSWHIIHSDHGGILLGVWYRPPAYGEVASICSLERELAANKRGCIGTLLVGDMNVHHSGWLSHSKGVTPEGRSLYKVCVENGLVERSARPTRGKYLLDLSLTDIPGTVVTSIHSGVSDHHIVLCDVMLKVSPSIQVRREGFIFSRAGRLEQAFEIGRLALCAGCRRCQCCCQHI